jgi:hypothetical protein
MTASEIHIGPQTTHLVCMIFAAGSEGHAHARDLPAGPGRGRGATRMISKRPLQTKILHAPWAL